MAAAATIFLGHRGDDGEWGEHGSSCVAAVQAEAPLDLVKNAEEVERTNAPRTSTSSSAVGPGSGEWEVTSTAWWWLTVGSAE